MQLTDRPDVHLTYCSNIHPGDDWAQTRANVLAHFAAVRRRVAPDRPFGVGLRLSALALDQLQAIPGELGRFADALRDAGLYVFTINGFAQGQFHEGPVKQQVYRPAWSDPDRLRYTEGLVQTLAKLLPVGVPGSISTVPGGFRGDVWQPDRRAAIVDHLLRCAASAWAIAEREGKRITLALEPEPHCMLETTNEAIAWFKTDLLSAGPIARMAELTGLANSAAEQAIRDHLGVCVDACHAAVGFESPRAGVEGLFAAGIQLAKLQVTAGLEVVPSPATLEALETFADPIYLHQVVAEHDDGSLTRWLDLPEVIAAARSGQLRARRWRVHFHVPVCHLELPPFRSTQDFLGPLLSAAVVPGGCRQLEVETYTWNVLPTRFRAEPVDDAIARELRWVLDQLGEASQA